MLATANDPDHFRLSPSSSSRWIPCPGSAIADLPHESNPKSEAGDVAHNVCDDYLTSDWSGSFDVLARMENDIYAGCEPLVGHDDAEEIAVASSAYVDCVKEYTTDDCVREHELKFRHDEIEDFGGTVDTLIWDAGKQQLTIVDLKTGRHKVPAKKNTQLKSYSLLARQYLEYEGDVRAIIVQDRVYAKPQVATFTKQQLDEFEEQVAEAAVSDERVAGGHCWFCPIKENCYEHHQMFGS